MIGMHMLTVATLIFAGNIMVGRWAVQSKCEWVVILFLTVLLPAAGGIGAALTWVGIPLAMAGK